MNKYLLDTCFVLGLFKGDKTALNLMQDISPYDCYVSVVNRIELLGYHGITPHDERELTSFLNEIICLPLSTAIENKAIEVRKRHKIKLADSIVLATALTHGLTLLTLDERLDKRYQTETTND